MAGPTAHRQQTDSVNQSKNTFANNARIVCVQMKYSVVGDCNFVIDARILKKAMCRVNQMIRPVMASFAFFPRVRTLWAS